MVARHFESRGARRVQQKARRLCFDTAVRKHAVVGVAALCSFAFAAGAARGAAPLTLEQRLLRPNELKGFTPVGQHPVIRSVGAWSGGNVSVADLRKHGFVAGAREKLYSKALNADGLSVAVQFRTAKGAQAEMRSELAYFRSVVGTYEPFSVRRIPGARGYTAIGGGAKGYNIYFSDGSFEYLVGAGFSLSASKAPSKAQVISAAAELYHRVHRRPAR